MKKRILLEFPNGATQEQIDGLVDLINRKTIHSSNVVARGEHHNIFNAIRQWAQDKGIYDKGDPKTQTLKLVEEVGELSKAILTNDKLEVIDGIGDCIVVLTNLAMLNGLFVEDCIESAYNVIANRKGSMQNGTFVKE